MRLKSHDLSPWVPVSAGAPHHHLLASTKRHCMVTEAHRCDVLFYCLLTVCMIVFVWLPLAAKTQWISCSCRESKPRPLNHKSDAHFTNTPHTWKVGMCRKLKFGLDSVLKKTEMSKNLTSVHYDRSCMQSGNSNKWLKVTLLALNVPIKNVLKYDRNRV